MWRNELENNIINHSMYKSNETSEKSGEKLSGIFYKVELQKV